MMTAPIHSWMRWQSSPNAAVNDNDCTSACRYSECPARRPNSGCSSGRPSCTNPLALAWDRCRRSRQECLVPCSTPPAREWLPQWGWPLPPSRAPESRWVGSELLAARMITCAALCCSSMFTAATAAPPCRCSLPRRQCTPRRTVWWLRRSTFLARRTQWPACSPWWTSWRQHSRASEPTASTCRRCSRRRREQLRPAALSSRRSRMARDAVGRATAAAERSLAEGSPAACLALLPAVPPPYRQQLQALCHIVMASSGARPSITAWWKVGGRVDTCWWHGWMLARERSCLCLPPCYCLPLWASLLPLEHRPTAGHLPSPPAAVWPRRCYRQPGRCTAAVQATGNAGAPRQVPPGGRRRRLQTPAGRHRLDAGQPPAAGVGACQRGWRAARQAGAACRWRQQQRGWSGSLGCRQLGASRGAERWGGRWLGGRRRWIPLVGGVG